MDSVLMQAGTLFMLIMIGVLGAKLKWLDKGMRVGISNLLVNFATPCVILQSFQAEKTADAWFEIGISALMIGGCMVISTFICKLIFRNQPKERAGALVYATSFGNTGYMGVPIINAFIGSAGLIPLSVGIAVFNLFTWTLGVHTINPSQVRLRKLLTFPCLYAVFAGIIMFALGIKIPAFFSTFLNMGAGLNTPLSLIMIGSILADAPIRDFFHDRSVFLSVLLRVVVAPAITLGLCTLLGIGGPLRATLVLLNGMPSAAATAMLTVLFGGDEKLGSRLVATSTLIYLFLLFFWIPVLNL